MDQDTSFEAFVERHQRTIWAAVCGRFGPDTANEALADALGEAWKRWPRIKEMQNPAGYVYRVAINAAFRAGRARPLFPAPPPETLPQVEPHLPDALASLSDMQRQAVWLVEACGYGLTESAEILGVSVSTLRNHLRRGMERLCEKMGVTCDV